MNLFISRGPAIGGTTIWRRGVNRGDRRFAATAARNLDESYALNEKTLVATLEIALSNFAQRSNQQIPGISFEKINKHLINPVTDREFDVLQHIYDGKPNRQIAEALFVSMNTVKKHINNTYIELDVNSRSTAITRLRELMLK